MTFEEPEPEKKSWLSAERGHCGVSRMITGEMRGKAMSQDSTCAIKVWAKRGHEGVP